MDTFTFTFSQWHIIFFVWRKWHMVRLRLSIVVIKNVDLDRNVAQWYSAGLRAGWSGVRVSAEAGNFSLHHLVQNGSGVHPASYPMGTRDSFPGDKAAGA
jgi:uncharacterized protein (DUF2336 family)